MTSTEFYRYRRSKGLCVSCGKPTADGGARCPECRVKNRESANADRAYYKKMGICPQCRKNKLYGQEKRCPECRAVNAEYKRKKYEREGTEERNAKQRAYQNERYAMRKATGLCPACGKRKGYGQYATCGICLEKSRQQKSRIRKLSGWREEAGICRFCDAPVEPGYKVCEKHHQMNIDKARSQKAVRARREASVLYGWGGMSYKEADAIGE